MSTTALCLHDVICAIKFFYIISNYTSKRISSSLKLSTVEQAFIISQRRSSISVIRICSSSICGNSLYLSIDGTLSIFLDNSWSLLLQNSNSSAALEQYTLLAMTNLLSAGADSIHILKFAISNGQIKPSG